MQGDSLILEGPTPKLSSKPRAEHLSNAKTHPGERNTAVAAARALGGLLVVVGYKLTARRLHHLGLVRQGVVGMAPRVRDTPVATHHLWSTPQPTRPAPRERQRADRTQTIEITPLQNSASLNVFSCTPSSKDYEHGASKNEKNIDVLLKNSRAMWAIEVGRAIAMGGIQG